jgi:hypothetical protein
MGARPIGRRRRRRGPRPSCQCPFQARDQSGHEQNAGLRGILVEFWTVLPCRVKSKSENWKSMHFMPAMTAGAPCSDRSRQVVCSGSHATAAHHRVHPCIRRSGRSPAARMPSRDPSGSSGLLTRTSSLAGFAQHPG